MFSDEFRESAIVGFLAVSFLAAWIPFFYSFIWAKIFSVESIFKFSLLSTFVAYGFSGLIAFSVGIPSSILLIKILPQVCEFDQNGVLCQSYPIIEAICEYGSWVLLLIVALISPAIVSRYYWFRR